MTDVLETLKLRRAELLERSIRLVDTTRERGLSALDRVQGGALDWHATLAARRAELRERAPKWFAFATVQLAIIERVDRALLSFGERVREEIGRLHRPEIGAAAPSPEAPKPAKASRPAKRAKTPAKASAKRGGGKKRLVLPIADYDSRTAKDIVAELPRLSVAQCGAVRAHEAATKNRKTVLSALDARLAD